MEAPNKICLIDTGDEIAWCDSVPSSDIEDSDVVWYSRTPDPLAEAVIKKIKETAEKGRRGSAINGHHCDCTASCQAIATIVVQYQEAKG